MKPLNEFISYVLSERKRTFTFNAFRHLTDLGEMLRYLDATLRMQQAGVGSSRRAYRINSRKVIKIAMNSQGIAQNKAEIETYTDPEAKPLMAKIFDYHDKFLWLEVEHLQKVDNKTFKMDTGIYFYDFCDCISGVLLDNEPIESVIGDIDDKRAIKLIKDTIGFARSTGTVVNDLLAGEQWGKTADGRYVVLDYGFNKEVAHLYGFTQF